jgi:hypothetical protein
MSSTKELILLFLCGSHNQYGHCGRGKMHIKLTAVKKQQVSGSLKRCAKRRTLACLCV